jgi:hypothetical protein
VNFAAITFCVASQRVFIVVRVYFVCALVQLRVHSSIKSEDAANSVNQWPRVTSLQKPVHCSEKYFCNGQETDEKRRHIGKNTTQLRGFVILKYEPEQ